jgi:hypothetical protein
VLDKFGLPDGGPPVDVTFGCEMRETGEIYRQAADGILGMGNNANALHSQVCGRGGGWPGGQGSGGRFGCGATAEGCKQPGRAVKLRQRRQTQQAQIASTLPSSVHLSHTPSLPACRPPH